MDNDGIPSLRRQFLSFRCTGGGSWDVLGSGRSGVEGQDVKKKKKKTGGSVSLETLHTLIGEISGSSQCIVCESAVLTHVDQDTHTPACIYSHAYCLYPARCRSVTLTWSPEPGMYLLSVTGATCLPGSAHVLGKSP